MNIRFYKSLIAKLDVFLVQRSFMKKHGKFLVYRSLRYSITISRSELHGFVKVYFIENVTDEIICYYVFNKLYYRETLQILKSKITKLNKKYEF